MDYTIRINTKIDENAKEIYTYSELSDGIGKIIESLKTLNFQRLNIDAKENNFYNIHRTMSSMVYPFEDTADILMFDKRVKLIQEHLINLMNPNLVWLIDLNTENLLLFINNLYETILKNVCEYINLDIEYSEIFSTKLTKFVINNNKSVSIKDFEIDEIQKRQIRKSIYCNKIDVEVQKIKIKYAINILKNVISIVSLIASVQAFPSNYITIYQKVSGYIAGTNDQYLITTDKANIYNEEDINSNVATELYYGNYVTVIKKDKMWYQVEYEYKDNVISIGWMKKTDLVKYDNVY